MGQRDGKISWLTPDSAGKRRILEGYGYKMYQFFVNKEQITGHEILITGSDVNHIKNVLRMKTGEEISVSNGEDQKEYRCRIEEIREMDILCKLCFVKEENLELPSKVYLFQGLPKADKMEFIIQKAVELGVFEIIPVASRRAVVRLDEKKEKNKLQRWNTIAQAAAKQSKRMVIPKVTGVMDFKTAAAYAGHCKVRLIPYELAGGMERTKEIFEGLEPGEDIAVFIGPEGGFDEKEVEFAREQGIEPVTLGKRILRTETAGLTVLSWIMYQLEM